MAKFNGVVKKVGCFPLKEKDKYENINRLALSVEIGGKDVWVGFGSTKHDGFLVQDDDDTWVVLGEDSEVVFKYDINGDFYNASKKDLVVMDLKVGKKFEAKAPAAAPVASSAAPAKPAWNNNQTRITFGMCMNNACNQLGSGYTPQALKERIVELFALAEEGAALAEKGSLSSWATGVAAAKKPAPEPEDNTEAEYDDSDIPFNAG